MPRSSATPRARRPPTAFPFPTLLLLLGACSAVSGCMISVAPVITPDAAEDVPGLVGTWEGEDGERAVIRSRGPGQYHITYEHQGSPDTFLARTGRLGRRLALDVWSTPRGIGAPDSTETSYRGTLVPGHLLLVIELDGDALRAWPIAENPLADAVRSGTVPIDGLELDGQVVLTSDSEALRSALSEYIERPGALDSPVNWRRVRP